MVSALISESALVLLLSFWLAGRSQESGQGSYPKPSISVSPGGVIPVGGNVTIRCRHQHLGMRFLLYKAGDGNYLTYTDPAGSEAEFPITSARREQSGNYTCHYSDRTVRAAYSEPSDPVQIIVAELSYPKPSISLSPSGGVALEGAVTVRCQGQRRGVRFVLNKERRHFPPVDSDDIEAVFPISNVRREDGGNYSCSYHSRSEPFAGSYPSDPVELVVRAGRPNLQAQLVPDGTVAEFPIPSVSREDGGSYTCDYRSIAEQSRWSYLSDPVEIIVADPSLPRPSISLSPTGVTAPGADVTIRCQGQRRDVRFFLHKAGDLNPPRHMDPAGDGAEFRIPTVGRQHGGSYSCSYRLQSEPFISSEPSDPVQLVVAGEIDPTQPGAAPDRVGPGGSESPAHLGQPSPIITGVSAAAAGLLLLLLLLLLVAFVCFRKTRARKGAAPRPSSTSPMGALKVPAQQDPTYASMDEGKEPQTLPQEPDPGADGLTYAELDCQALQAKRGGPAPAPEPAESSMYAVINVSRGPLQ
ncbi:immunoglobulin superfamily member 1-like isoform X2 [Malaclemys terrapin pileata]|uniref:immunoglobulin superfamily member 1-like isoform X2 n=1 Tax=Malaclemys terrapin pileata TaxID=2991368 RepID=UPI0023A8D174|nr:immunoglobulin superfamily member 1-like isoform X2 [Malaclemys terrapin pileata]